jgi:hypothetical protein
VDVTEDTMFVSSSRHQARTYRRASFTATLSAALAICAFASAPAFAAAAGPEPAPEPEANPASAQTNAELAVCPGQTFAQPFEAIGDGNYYTLAEGSQFEATGEGWTLLGGAKIVEGSHPDGSQGGVLDLPYGAVAISPPVCVTLRYPTARTWVESVQGSGSGSVTIAVAYGATAGKLSLTTSSVGVGSVPGKPASAGWELSQPFQLNPQLGGRSEGVRDAHFIYTATGSKKAEFHIWGLYVDPRFGN